MEAGADEGGRGVEGAQVEEGMGVGVQEGEEVGELCEVRLGHGGELRELCSSGPAVGGLAGRADSIQAMELHGSRGSSHGFGRVRQSKCKGVRW